MRKPTKTVLQHKHIANLAAIFGYDVGKMRENYTMLKRIETEGHKMSERYCNGEIDNETFDNFTNKVKNSLLHYIPRDVFKNIYLNSDPRGYYLKLDDDFTRKLFDQGKNIERDWGGYGIICPEGI